jgi:GrpB-like predicted nucleotidyltransferase (UPF0157 family)
VIDPNAPHNRPVTIVPYDSYWPVLFEGEKSQLLQTCKDQDMQIEHIGSTAIPGLAAKPTIDILIGIKDLEEANRLIPLLKEIGYVYVPEYEQDMPDRRYFYKGRKVEDDFHLHMVAVGSPFWKRHLAFRDYMRKHLEDVKEYELLKLTLAKKFGEDRNGYTDAKTEFITRIEKIALTE